MPPFREDLRRMRTEELERLYEWLSQRPDKADRRQAVADELQRRDAPEFRTYLDRQGNEHSTF